LTYALLYDIIKEDLDWKGDTPMPYGKNQYRRDNKAAGKNLWCTTKKNFVKSVNPQGKIHATRIPASARMVNGILMAIFKLLWNTGRRLLNR